MKMGEKKCDEQIEVLPGGRMIYITTSDVGKGLTMEDADEVKCEMKLLKPFVLDEERSPVSGHLGKL